MAIATDIQRDLSQAYTDFGRSVSYVAESSASLNFKTGSLSFVESVSTVLALRGRFKWREIEMSGGRLQLGDVWFEVRSADLTSPDRAGAVVDSGVRYQVIGWEERQQTQGWRLACRRA